MTTQQSTLTSRQQREVTRKAKAAAKAEGQTPKLCECNCGGYTVRQDASFISGHDQRHKGNLLRKFDGGDEAAVELMRRVCKSNDDLEARAEKREKVAAEKRRLAAEARVEKARVNAEAEAAAKAAKAKPVEPTPEPEPEVATPRRRRAAQPTEQVAATA
jgi:hypothetical protein